MVTRSFKNHPTASLVETIRIEDIVAGSHAKVHKAPRGSSIKLIGDGSARIYTTNTHQEVSGLDNTDSEITNSVNASWDDLTKSPVMSNTQEILSYPVETVAVVVSSGTWVLEVTV